MLKKKPIRRPFPGPPDASAELRVGFEKQAYSDFVAHAHRHLDREICGVLVGQTCEDEQGIFIHVTAVIEGTNTNQGSTHVTFTHETWDHIHAEIDERYPNEHVLGWYHTHPGFGVEFSDMDRFIQENFFPLPTQVALLTDPLSGDVALAFCGSSGFTALDRFWVDGRTLKCRVDDAPDSGVQMRIGAVADLELRVGQLISAVDELRRDVHRVLSMTLFAVVIGVASVVTYAVIDLFFDPPEPPRMLDVVPVPVTIDGETAVIQVGVYGWNLPESLKADLARKAGELERQKAAERKESDPP